jgi:lactoylglutathione lyase
MRIGLLASHERTTLQAIIEACSTGAIRGDVVVIISNNRESGALRRARARSISAHHLSAQTHPVPAELDAAIGQALVDHGVDVVVLAGYMKKLGPQTLSRFRGRVLNAHPDDAGPVIAQREVPVDPGDSPETLAERVQAAERDLLIETLRRMGNERRAEPAQATTLRLELFVVDLPASLDFYRRVLGFEPGLRQTGGYTPLAKGSVRIALNPRSDLADDHPLRMAAGERPGLGVEIVLEVEDIVAMHQRVVSQSWPLSGELSQQPWGLTDFRVADPDGYYWRVTSRSTKGAET